jgi:sugar lactone lactonase YvrE
MYELRTTMDGFPVEVTNPTHWVYAGTGVSAGDTLSHIIGWESDHVFDDGNTPAGLEVVAHSHMLAVMGTEGFSDVTVYYPSPSSLVFATGTIRWSWGLGKPGYEDSRVQRMTENVLARAGLRAEISARVGPAAAPSDVGTSPHVALVAGSGTPGLVDDQGAAAEFNAPAGAAADADGNIYVTDTRNNRIRKIAPDGTVTTLAGHGRADVSNGPRFANGARATFNVPTGIAVGPDGNVYISDTLNNLIRLMTPDGAVKTFAGSGVGDRSDAVNPLRAGFSYPRGLAFAPDGALYVADSGNHAIRRIGADGVTTAAHGDTELDAVAVGSDGTVYATSILGTVFTLSGGNLVPIVDLAEVDGDLGGPGAAAMLRPSDGLAVDGDSLIVADSANYKVRRVALSGDHTVTTLVGDGRAGIDLGTGATAHVVTPRGIAVTASGYLVADSGNNRILRIAR